MFDLDLVRSASGGVSGNPKCLYLLLAVVGSLLYVVFSPPVLLAGITPLCHIQQTEQQSPTTFCASRDSEVHMVYSNAAF